MLVERMCVGLDVHAWSVEGAALDVVTGELLRASMKGTDPGLVLSWLDQLPGPVVVAYEAGPTGFGLYRALTAAGYRCEVLAPSKLLRASGDRVKTDKRDAFNLARMLRVGEVPAITVPSLEQEAARDLVRAREDVRGDLMRARHRTSKLLLRYGIVYPGATAWTKTHLVWLRQQRFDLAGVQAAHEANLDAVQLGLDRRDRLDEMIAEISTRSEYAPVATRLGCLRGVSTLTGFALAVEIGDWDRFTGSSIAAYVGLVPSEHSSGGTRSQGSITKAGNTHARRLLVEAAWHHRKSYTSPSVAMQARWAVASQQARARGHAGNRRLHSRWVRFDARKKKSTIGALPPELGHRG